jgi:hypothetical protein
VFAEFRYRMRETWSRARRVIGNAEYLDKGEHPRFVVISWSPEQMEARRLCKEFYCARADMENRIEEQQLALFADRTSTSWMRSNQIWLYCFSIAYCLMQALRPLGLAGTEMAKAQCQTIRLRLLGAHDLDLSGGRPPCRRPVCPGLSQPHRRCCAAMLRLSRIRRKIEVSLLQAELPALRGAPCGVLNENTSQAAPRSIDALLNAQKRPTIDLRYVPPGLKTKFPFPMPQFRLSSNLDEKSGLTLGLSG